MLQVTPSANLVNLKNGDPVKVTGLITVRQRPGTAKGVMFITIEDETGFCNLVVFENVFEKFRKEILQARLLMVEGMLQIEGIIIHVIVKRCFNLTGMLHKLSIAKYNSQPVSASYSKDDKSLNANSNADQKQQQPAKQKEIFYKGRNFK